MSEKTLREYQDLPVSEFWASQPKPVSGIAAFGGADPAARLVTDTVAPAAPAPRNYKTASDLCQIANPQERVKYTMGTEYMLDAKLGALCLEERKKPEDEWIRFYPKW